MNNIKIRKCNTSDIESIRYLQPEGWDDITYYFRFYCEHSFCYPIVALLERKIVGVAAGILNEKTGWLAHIIVSQTHRRQGFGLKLTQHIMDYLYEKGCETLLLIATEPGEPLYRKCGFETVGQYQLYKTRRLDQPSECKNIRDLMPSDMAQVFQLDGLITGENRKNMIENFLVNGRVYSIGKKIKGFFLPEPGEGMIIADDDEAGIELLKFKLRLKDGKAGLPAENHKGIELLEAYGFKRFTSPKRMICGKNIKWQPGLIYSRAGGFYG